MRMRGWMVNRDRFYFHVSETQQRALPPPSLRRKGGKGESGKPHEYPQIILGLAITRQTTHSADAQRCVPTVVLNTFLLDLRLTAADSTVRVVATGFFTEKKKKNLSV